MSFSSDASEVLNGITAPDSYTPAATLGFTPSSRVLIDVVNQAIFWQLAKGIGTSAGVWEDVEVKMIPGSRVIIRPGLMGVRVRAAIPLASLPAGSFQAVVTVELVKSHGR